MKECNCVVIDDKRGFSTSALITNFLNQVYENNQIKINFYQLNPKEERFVDENGFIIRERIINELNSPKYLQQLVHLIVCDYDLTDDKINGFEVIRILRKDIKTKKKILLYSSNLSDVVDKIIQGEKEEVSDKIIDLVNSNISAFCKRDQHLLDAILKHLLEELVFSTDKFIESELYKYKDYKFKLVYDKFENKSLGDIAEIIEKNRHEGEILKKEIVEQVIAYMINLENE